MVIHLESLLVNNTPGIRGRVAIFFPCPSYYEGVEGLPFELAELPEEELVPCLLWFTELPVFFFSGLLCWVVSYVY